MTALFKDAPSVYHILTMNTLSAKIEPRNPVKPLCAYFGDCGGCLYQNFNYEEELKVKSDQLKELWGQAFPNLDCPAEPVIPSPNPYYYRHRIDLTMKLTREGWIMGFQHEGRRKMLEVEACVIAREEVSSFLPELKKQAVSKWKEGYRTANLVIKTGDDGRVLWGGIGRRSLETADSDFLWTEIHGKRIFYSLDTFFQSNLGILPKLMEEISKLANFDRNTLFLDLYAGVGLFGIYFSDQVGELRMIEDCKQSVRLMRWNANYHHMDTSSVVEGKVEQALPLYLSHRQGKRTVAMVDPPRKGLHAQAAQTLAELRDLDLLFYLSCNPESLLRDLKIFFQEGWKIIKMIPFDFFPKTRHLETLVCLTRP